MRFPEKDRTGVTIRPGLRIYCADRMKTYRQEASGLPPGPAPAAAV